LLGLALNAAAADVVAPPVQPSAEPLVHMVQAAVTTYTLALQELGVTRKRPIKIKLSNNLSDYETHTKGYVIQYLDQQARWPNGLAYLDAETLMIKAIAPYDPVELQQRVWHEMTHALQYDLSNGGSARARPWLTEGMADLFAFLAAGKADADSIKQWKATLNRKLLAANSVLTPAQLIDLDSFDWDELSTQSQGANYVVADLMVLHLYETNGAGSIAQMASYYGCLVQGLTPEKACFTDTLGLTPETFTSRMPRLAGR
jgi:hypothetical protein